jgi:hypothetical protein
VPKLPENSTDDKDSLPDPAVFMNSRYNIKMLDKAHKEIKSVQYQADKVVCNQENRHIEINVAFTSDPNHVNVKPNYLDLCSNT